MARTPIFGRLERLLDLDRAAKRLGVDCVEAEGRQGEFLATDEGMTRRSALMKGALAAAAATAAGQAILHPKLAFGAGPSTQPRVAVIGAGISGMTAAMTLKDAGFTNVTVYEANNRIGGRTYTNNTFWEPGQYSEWGGELIDSIHKQVFTLCQRFGFKTIDCQWHSVNTRGVDVLHFNGGYYPWSTMLADWDAGNLKQKIQSDMQTLPPWPWAYNANWSPAALAIDNTTLYDWIESRVPGGHNSRLGKFLDAAYNIEYGEETQRQGASGLLSMLGFSTGNGNGAWWAYGKSDERWRIVGGNQQLSLAQADYVGNSNVRLGWTMNSVRANTNGTVTVEFTVGGQTQTVTADRVILAIPLGVMKKIKAAGGFTYAGFDARKRGFIDNYGFGADNKLQLQIADRFWTQPGPWGESNGESFGDRGYQLAWHVTAGQPGTKGIINNFTGGDVSRLLNPTKPFSDTGDPDPAVRGYVTQAARTFLQQIEPVFPGMTAKWTGKATLSTWHTNPYAYGSYAYYGPGYLHQYSTYERVPMGSVHFAGEHCSQDFQGFIEGGIVEGQRAANELVALYK